MPTIERITIHRHSLALARPFVTAVRTARSVDALILQVRDSDGRVGWGEAPTSWRVTGESAASVVAAVEGPLAEAILGLPTDDPAAVSGALERAVVRNSSARMALDCAVYDLAARAAGRPLHRFLGGETAELRSDMTLSAALEPAGVDELLRTAQQHVDDGFTTLKVKVGAGTDDLATVAAVRAAVGPGVALRVDANQSWTVQEAISIIRRWDDDGVGVEFVEQPVHRDDLAGLALVTEQVSTPIVADESVWSRRELREALARHSVDVVNVKLAKTGGIRDALELVALARAEGVGVIVGCMSETHVGIAAAAAVASAVEPHAVHDLDAGLWLTGSPVTGGVEYRGERIRLSPDPGTGIRGSAV